MEHLLEFLLDLHVLLLSLSTRFHPLPAVDGELESNLAAVYIAGHGGNDPEDKVMITCPGTYTDSYPGTYTDSYPGSYTDSYPGSCTDSYPGSCTDSYSGSYTDWLLHRLIPRLIPSLMHRLIPVSYTDSYPGSCTDSYPGLYTDSYPGSYTDSYWALTQTLTQTHIWILYRLISRLIHRLIPRLIHRLIPVRESSLGTALMSVLVIMSVYHRYHSNGQQLRQKCARGPLRATTCPSLTVSK